MSRRSAVLAVLVLGGAVLLSAVPTWVSGTTVSALGPQVALAVAGTQAAAGVLASGLALLAAGVAGGLVGRMGRWVVVVVLFIASVVVIWSAIAVIVNPRSSALAAAASQTGVASLLAEPGVSLWPWITALLGAAGLLLSVAVAKGSRTWTVTSQRHERVRTRAGDTTVSGPEPRLAQQNDRPDQSDESDQADFADLWDAQTRGDDN